jgi:hypothetical protein
MPGFFDLDPHVLARVAADTARLLCEGPAWIERRKQRVVFIDDQIARHQVTVDFGVPPDVFTTEDGAGKTVAYLPLFVLRKAQPQQLLDFDFRDEANKALPLPTRQFNSAISEAALRWLATSSLRRVFPGAQLGSQRLDQLRVIAQDDPAVNAPVAESLLHPNDSLVGVTARATLANDTDFRFLVRLFAWTSVIVVPVSPAKTHHILKLSFSEPINQMRRPRAPGMHLPVWSQIRAGLSPLGVQVDVPFMGARTFHIEVHPPEGMESRNSLIAARRTDGGVAYHTGSQAGSAMHLYVPDAGNLRSGFAQVPLQVRPDRFIAGALMAAVLVSAAIAACILFAPSIAQNNTTAPALLLLLPGLIATYMSRRDHALVVKLLSSARLLLAFAALAAYLSAAWLVIAPERSQAAPSTVLVDLDKQSSDPDAESLHETEAGVTPTPTDSSTIFTGQEMRRPVTSSLRTGWAILLIVSVISTGVLGIAYLRARRPG